MLSYDRRKELLKLLRERKTIQIAQAAKQFCIGEATIRRDLEKLERQGLVRRIYGGAVLLEGLDAEIPMNVREKTEHAQKDSIARLTAGLVNDGDVIILDSSSTVLCMVPYLRTRRNLTIITNGLRAADLAGDIAGAVVFCTGGKLRELSKSLAGAHTRQFVRTHRAHKLFLSCRALDLQLGVCDSSEEEAELRRDMIAASDMTILMAVSSKFDKSAFCRVCGLSEIGTVITDKEPSPQWMQQLEQGGTRLLVP